jgi:hypothetical protein
MAEIKYATSSILNKNSESMFRFAKLVNFLFFPYFMNPKKIVVKVIIDRPKIVPRFKISEIW